MNKYDPDNELEIELEMLEKRIEATREWNRKTARDSWVAIIAASISLIVSILRILLLLIPLLR